MADNYLDLGNHNVICDICARKKKRSQCKMTWDNYLACADRCWYPKHPAIDPLPLIVDGLPVPNARPRAENQFITLNGLSTWDNQVHTQAVNGRLAWGAADVKWEDM